MIPVAIIYGFCPNLLFDVDVNTNDESNIFSAIMGLYFAFAILWILGIIDKNYWKTATTSNMLFMLGLTFGRLISMFFDGFPTSVFVLGTIGEMVLGFYALYQLKLLKQ